MPQAVQAVALFALGMAVATAGAVWWVHEPAARVVGTIATILAIFTSTDLMRWLWWKHAAKRRAA
jgi:hypothetical protein